MSYTAKDLAAELGLSAAAVSMAINGKPGVSAATRKRVLEAAKSHGMEIREKKETPKAVETGTLSLLIYQKQGAVLTETPFFFELIAGVEEAARLSRYALNVHYLSADQSIRAQLNRLNYCNGMILLATEMKREDFAAFENVRVPIVVLDTYYENLPYDCVLINNFQGAYNACLHQIRRWKSQPGYLKSVYSIGNFDERADGFYKAVRENGFSASKSQVLQLAPSMDGAYNDMRQLLAQGEKPARCYVADNDLIAAGVMKALKEAGYRVPEDVSIVGFDDMPMCRILEPSLSTVQVPKRYLGSLAVQRLIERIKDPSQPIVKQSVQAVLVRRTS